MPEDTILIVEDEPALLRGLTDNFEQKGYRVLTADDGEKGLHLALHKQPSLIVLDIMLPKINGYEICRQIRKQNLDVPIIMLTAKGEESDVVLGLNLGADDYVTKPFSIRELLARVEAMLRRAQQIQSRRYHFGDFELDMVGHRLLRNGEEVTLTPKEFSMLQLLVRYAGRALTRDEILDHVWGGDILVTRRSVDRCITTLRAKIEPEPQNPIFIKTVRDLGYRFEPQ
ncbi:MAG: response regulator transcription factor [Phycisphaerae bacterium]|nr:response regulator transcription factor [Phycisphaerae bacterium]